MRLSICIPTYNRAPELRVLLDSIVAQAGYGLDLEIAISDNASTDDTHTLVSSYADKGLCIVYRRLDTNSGFDRNLLNAVAIASGEFCWLMGSDDIVESGALARIEAVLQNHPLITGISVGSHGYDAELTKRTSVHNNIATYFTAETILTGRASVISTVGPWLGYMSSIVVRREAWTRAVEVAPIEPYLCGYVHTYVTACLLNDQSIWICVPDILVGCRLGNDSFRSDNEFGRTQLDILGYDMAFGDTLGRHHWAYRSAMSKVSTFYVRSHFLSAKMAAASGKYWKQAIPMSLTYFWKYPAFWIKVLPISLVPRPVLVGMRALFRRTLKKSGFGKGFA